MSKHGDYKTADAPKAEPLKASLGDLLKAALTKTAASERRDDKEQTP